MTTAYLGNNSVPMASLPTTSGIIQNFLAGTTNISDASYAADGLAASPIFGLGGQQLQGDEIVAGGIATLVSYIGPLLNSGALCWILFQCAGGAQQVAQATHSQHAITKGQADALAANPGDIKYSAANAVPPGWLKANGALVSRTTYAQLFAAIGTTYGAGDGSTTFALPDLRGEFLRGYDDGRGIDPGRAFGSAQKGTLYPYDTNTSNANGIWSASTSQSTGTTSQVALGVDTYVTTDYASVTLGGIDATVNYALPGLAGDRGYTGITRPRNIALLVLIKY